MIKIKNSTIFTDIINHSLVDNIRIFLLKAIQTFIIAQWFNAVFAYLRWGMENLILINSHTGIKVT